MTTAAQEKIETYLGTLRTRLRGLGNEEVNDIVENCVAISSKNQR
jgi:hypothetical protein